MLNVRLLRNKSDFIIDYISEHYIDVMCVTETWLTSNDDSQMPTYQLVTGFDIAQRSSRWRSRPSRFVVSSILEGIPQGIHFVGNNCHN